MGWAGFESTKIQSLICVQNSAVYGALLVYFPWFWYHLPQIHFRHSLKQTPAYLSCSPQMHTGSGAIWPRLKWGNLFGCHISQRTPSSAAIYVVVLQIHSPIPFLPPSLCCDGMFFEISDFHSLFFSSFLLQYHIYKPILANPYMFRNHWVEFRNPEAGFIGLTDPTLQSQSCQSHLIKLAKQMKD